MEMELRQGNPIEIVYYYIIFLFLMIKDIYLINHLKKEISLVATFVRKLFGMRFFTKASEEFFLRLTQDAVKLRQGGCTEGRTDYLSHLIQLQERGNTIHDSVGHALTVHLDGYETSGAVLYHMLYSVRQFYNIYIYLPICLLHN